MQASQFLSSHVRLVGRARCSYAAFVGCLSLGNSRNHVTVFGGFCGHYSANVFMHDMFGMCCLAGFHPPPTRSASRLGRPEPFAVVDPASRSARNALGYIESLAHHPPRRMSFIGPPHLKHRGLAVDLSSATVTCRWAWQFEQACILGLRLVFNCIVFTPWSFRA